MFARDTYTATGASQNLAISFPYLQRSHVVVLVNDAVQVEGVGFTFVNDGTINLTATAGAEIVIYRDSSRGSRLTSYIDGALLNQAPLNVDSKQAFYMAQEALDGGAENSTAINDLENTVADHETRIDALEAGGGGTLDGLSDVNAPSPTDGQALVWDDTAGEWVAGDPSGGGGGGAWGAITGTLSDQTDLQAALDSKAAVSHTHNGITWTFSDSAPSSPTAGDRWVKTSTGREYTYLNDGSSSQWVELGLPGSSSAGSALSLTWTDWTPTDISGAGLTLTNGGCKYARIGTLVILMGRVGWPSTSDTNGAKVSVPVVPNAGYPIGMGMVWFSSLATQCVVSPGPHPAGELRFNLGTDYKTNANLSGAILDFIAIYRAA